ncbi:SH3-like domain-containing protein [Beijerinckia sp. L45]|uniref:SH3-like domain-containing protein n=1 Tax=Beijerinckia sp. L45 TaxID=1641855 RepID=UPI001AEE4665
MNQEEGPSVQDKMTGATGHPTGPHDVGGHPGPTMLKDEHQHVLWERRVDAMMMLLTHPSRKLLILDELRRNVEALGPGAYETMGYYERWIAAITAAMIDRGVVSSDELGRKMAEVEARGLDRP